MSGWLFFIRKKGDFQNQEKCEVTVSLLEVRKKGKECYVNLFRKRIQEAEWFIHSHGDSVLKGNGMVSDPSEEKRTNI